MRRSDGAASATAVRNLIRGAGARFAEKVRGPDHGGGRKVPRRNSYDVDDKRAQPWKKVGDGSYAQAVIHREALIKTAKEQRRTDWERLPNRRLREIREQRHTLAAELAVLIAQGHAPVGRPATIRHEIERLDTAIARADVRLTRIDITVLDALLERIDHATGALFPSYETIAEWAVCSRNAAIKAIARLKARGFIDWVRRSIRTNNEGEFAPQREQTSNAYYFDHRRSMERGTWQRYIQILVAKLRRLGAVPAALAPDTPREVQYAPLREALASAASSFANVST
ncbi:helix-turn-helix domain-containing protein [Sphingomonas aerolata]|uniref:helix-turn-helix domain-containing protein n=1 Tax=Sphingomonas aerolata TaxID=185951 RepID=UPI0035A6C9CB